MKKTFGAILLLICCALLVFPVCAAPTSANDENIRGVEQLFADLKTAYESENLGLFLTCFAPVIPSTDVTRDSFIMYTEEMTRAELEGLFVNFDGIVADFLDIRIITDRDQAMVRTTRRAGIAGFMIAYCDMIFTLQKDGHGWGGRNWRIVNQVLVNERYEFPEAPAGYLHIETRDSGSVYEGKFQRDGIFY